MSAIKIRTPYDVAYRQALAVLDVLAPYCEQIEIAGSLRRQQPMVGDIEIVCQPQMLTCGLFEDQVEVNPDFCAIVDDWLPVIGHPTGRYTRRVLPSTIELDLFMGDADNWGSMLLIRTGSAAFSKWVMGTLLPRHGYRQHKGYVWHGAEKVSVPTEERMFELAGLSWIRPSQRVEPRR